MLKKTLRDELQEDLKGKLEKELDSCLSDNRKEWDDVAYLLGPFDVVRVLADDPENEPAAKKELARAIEENPDAELEVPSDLDYLLDDFAPVRALANHELYCDALAALHQITLSDFFTPPVSLKDSKVLSCTAILSGYQLNYQVANLPDDLLFLEVMALVKENMDAKAEAQLRKLILANPLVKVPDDLKFLLDEKLAAVRSLADRKLYGEALDQLRVECGDWFTKTKIWPTDSCLNYKGEDVILPDDLLFLEVQALVEEGENKKAADRLGDLISANPKADVPDELDFLLDELAEPLSLFDQRVYWDPAVYQRQLMIEHNPLYWAVTLIGILLLPVVLAVIWRILKWVWAIVHGLISLGLDIEDFEIGTSGQDTAVASALARAVEEEIIQLSTQGDRSLPHVVAAPMQEAQLPESVTATAPEPLKTLLALVKWALSHSVMSVSGYMRKEKGRGVGLTLVLKKKPSEKILAEQTLWQNDYKINKEHVTDADAYYRLAKPAAVWVLYQYKQARPGILRRLCRLFKQEFNLLGAEDWQSYAYFVAGVDSRLEKDRDNRVRAQGLFLDALNRDRNNRGAAYNLGILDLEQGAEAIKPKAGKSDPDDEEKIKQERCYDRGIERLELARRASRKRWLVSKWPLLPLSVFWVWFVVNRDSVWYKATYQLAAAHFYQHQQKSLAKRNSLECAKCEAKKLVDAIDIVRCPVLRVLRWPVRQIERVFLPRKHTQWKAFGDFLDLLRALAVILYKSLAVVDPAKKEAKTLIEEVIADVKEPNTVLSYRVQYNLACCCSVLGQRQEENENDGLHQAKQSYQRALYHLENAFQRRGDIVRWAQDDPALEGVRDSELKDESGKTFSTQFGDLVDEYLDKKPESLPLAVLIGKENARLLKQKAEIKSWSDLRDAANERKERKELAEKCGLSSDQLWLWVRWVDMMRIVNNLDYVTLLAAADVSSVEDLGKKYGKDLLKIKLGNANETRKLVEQVPETEILKTWIKAAKNATRFVQS